MEFVIGIFVGALLFWLFFGHKKASGTFVIDFSDPAKDICRFDMNESLDTMCKKKRVIFNVKFVEMAQE